MKTHIHVLLVTFNVDFYEKTGKFFRWGRLEKAKSKMTDLDFREEWMRRRIILFRTFCLPSVLKQTNDDFDWFIGMDSRTPECHIDRIREMVSIRPRTHVMLCERNSWIKDVRRKIHELGDGAETLVTSRLDSDDAIAPGYMARICLPELRHSAVTCTTGAQLDIKTGKSRVLLSETSPFQTLVEPLSQCITARGINHGRFGEGRPVRSVKTQSPMWLQVCHGWNLCNHFGSNQDTKVNLGHLVPPDWKLQAQELR